MRNRGFTLIELIVSVAIIGVLTGITIMAINPIRQLAGARNSIRQNDVNTIYAALGQYISDKQTTPTGLSTTPKTIGTTGGTTYIDLTPITPDYVGAIPTDPSGGTAGDTGYTAYLAANGRPVIESQDSEIGKLIVSKDNQPTNYALNFTIPGAAPFQYVGASNPAALQVSNLSQGTWSIWFNTSDATKDQVVMSKNGGAPGFNYIRLIPNGAPNAGTVRVYVTFYINGAQASYNPIIAANRLLPNTWHHVAATYDGSKITTYIDGTAIGSTPASGLWSINTGAFQVGALNGNTTTTTFRFAGQLDEPRIYSRALSASEVSAQYNQGKGHFGAPETGLLLGWRLDEGTGTVVNDHSGQGISGTLFTSPTWTVRP